MSRWEDRGPTPIISDVPQRLLNDTAQDLRFALEPPMIRRGVGRCELRGWSPSHDPILVRRVVARFPGRQT